MDRLDQRHMLVPYWDGSVDESMQLDIANGFSREIYPIWSPLFQREYASEAYDDMETVHKADWEIFSSGIKPKRFVIRPEQAAMQEKKARMKSKFESVMDD